MTREDRDQSRVSRPTEGANSFRARIAQLSPEKRALLEQRLLTKEGGEAQTMRRRRAGDPSPMSFAQQRLWFLDQCDLGAAVYNAALALRLEGDLNISALRGAVTTIVERHEVLRTTFTVEGGAPRQIVQPPTPVNVRVLDLRNLRESTREAGARHLLLKEVQRPFDLSKDLMLRVALLRLGDDKYILLLATHHIASDGWSKGILFQELALLYAAFANGKPSPLPPLPVQYADFALWQQEFLRGEALEKLAGYWQQQLAGAPHVLKLPTDRPRPRGARYRGAHHTLAYSQILLEAIRTLSRREGTTLFMTLLAAFKTLLYFYTDQQDILAGSPIAGRNRIETESLIGFFVNTLVLRTDLSGNPSFSRLLGRVRDTTLGAMAHQDLPFEKLVELLRPKRQPGVNPLFQVNFRAQTAVPPPPQFPGLSATCLDFDPGISRFDLALELSATTAGLVGYIEYNIDLFEAATIARMAKAFESLLGALVFQPDTPLDRLKPEVFPKAIGVGMPSLHRRATARVPASGTNPNRSSIRDVKCILEI